MSELLKIVLSLSLSGTLLFFILLALKPLYKNKLSKRWQYYIWLIVIARMLLPFTPETTLIGSAFGYLGNTSLGIIQSTPPTNNVQSDFGLSENYTTPNTEPQVPKSTTDTTMPFSIQTILLKVYENLWILWVAIAFALLIRKITMYQSFVCFIKAGRTEVSDIEILNLLADVGETIGIKRPVELFLNPLISSPMLLGFFRPYIILPSIEIERTELAYIMQHELTHYRYLDMCYKWLVQITVCLHWFNPFVYLMAKEINKGCELSCDETIIKIMDNDEKKAYGDTLLNSLKTIGNYNDKLATVTLTEGAEQLKERLDAIMKFKKASKITVSVMLSLTLIFAVGATAIGAYAATPKPISNNSNTEITQTPINNNSINNLQQISTSSSGLLPDNTNKIAISFDIDNGGIEILPATSNEIKAIYDSEYYNVTIANKNGKWIVNVSGKVAMMGKTNDVRIYIPDVKCTMNVDVLNGNFNYALPNNCMDIISVTAENAGVDFTSKNQYKNSAISLIATDKDFIKYEPPIYPSYFTKTNTGFEYLNGTRENKIDISLVGYTSVEFKEQESSTTPWSTMGGNEQYYTYSQQGYYQGNYIFELGWNLNTKGYDTYSDKTKITLSDGLTITVSFDKSCKNESQDNAVLSDLKELVERLKKQYANSTLTVEKPLVVSVKYVGNSDLVKLAQTYYIDGELSKFSALFSSLDITIQKEYCIKMVENGKTAFLSSCAESMNPDMLNDCAEKTYQEGKIALFSCLIPYLSYDQKQTWIVRASRDGKNTFLSVLTEDESSN